MTPRRWLWAKIVISLLLLAWIISTLDFKTVLFHVTALDPSYLLAVFTLSILGLFISTEKWRLLLVSIAHKHPFFALLRLFWIGTFFNNFLPGRTGGDVIRAYGISRQAQDKTPAALTVVVDRVLNLIALLGIALITFIGSPHILPQNMRQNFLLTVLVLCGIGLLGTVLLVVLAQKITYLKSIVSFGKTLLQKPMQMTLAMGLALLYQATMILSNYIIALGLGFQLSPSIFFIVIPLTALATMIPISLNGWGLREGAYALSFQTFGVAPELAVTLSIIATLCMVGVSSVGGLFYVFQNVDIPLTNKYPIL